MTRFLASITMGVLATFATANAQTYPTKPIHVIVPLTAGSVTDLAVRALGAELTPRLGQPWVVENRPGANMIVGMEACARAAADGYTLCATSAGPSSFNPHLLNNLPYDAAKDFTPVINLFNVMEGVLVAAVPARSAADLSALAVAKTTQLNFGTLGPGSTPDIYRQWLNDRWKSDLVEVSYKGGGEVAQALFKGEVQVAKIGIGNVAGQLRDGQVRVLAVESGSRSPLLPDVQTTAEAGLGGYPVRVWWGIVAPAGTPVAVVNRLNAEITRVYAEPKLKEFLTNQFLESNVGPASDFAAFMTADRQRVGELLQRFKVPRQ